MDADSSILVTKYLTLALQHLSHGILKESRKSIIKKEASSNGTKPRYKM